MLELTVTVSSHARVRVAAAGATKPPLQHVPRECFLKMVVHRGYSVPKAGVDAESQRSGKLMVEQSTNGG